MNSSLSDGDAVGEWKDLSGNGNDAKQSISSKQPVYSMNTFGAKSGINFNGTSDYLQTGEMNYPINKQSMYAVVKLSLDTGSSKYQYILGLSDNDRYYFFGAKNKQYAVFYGDGNNWGDLSANDGDVIDISGKVYLLAAVQSGKDESFVNGISQETDYNLMGIPGLIKTNIGASNIQDQFWSGDIHEILLFNKDITYEDHWGIQSYLSNKWNLASTVDSDDDGLMDADDPEPTVNNWEIIVFQDSDLGEFSSNTKNTYLENENNPSSSTYMKIGNLNQDEYRDQNDEYKFKLSWDGGTVESTGINKDVIWKQTSWIKDSVITGFQEIGTSGFANGNVGSGFWGLGKSDSSRCVIDGNAMNSAFHNCVGIISKWGGGIAGPLELVANKMELYIWSETE